MVGKEVHAILMVLTEKPVSTNDGAGRDGSWVNLRVFVSAGAGEFALTAMPNDRVSTVTLALSAKVTGKLTVVPGAPETLPVDKFPVCATSDDGPIRATVIAIATRNTLTFTGGYLASGRPMLTLAPSRPLARTPISFAAPPL